MFTERERRQKVKRMPKSRRERTDIIFHQIRSMLGPHLLTRKYAKRFDAEIDRANKWGFAMAKSWGCCYAATEALFHMAAGQEGYRPHVMRVDAETTHWFLRNPQSGHVLDPTFDQFLAPLDYTRARACGFLTKSPSRRARTIMDDISRWEKP